jgi:hypothetical protein
MEKFQKTPSPTSAPSSPGIDIFQAAREKLKTTSEESHYIQTDFVDITSDTCERLFSRARLVFHYLRRSMTPASVELVLYLWTNFDLWDVYTVNSILGNDLPENSPSDSTFSYVELYENLSMEKEN